MEITKAVKALTAMAQETRLSVLKILVQYGKQGAPAGAISKKLDIPHNTLSFHLSHLGHAGLVTSERNGRSIIYYANLNNIQNLVGYIMENCCGDDSSCLPADCKPPIKAKKKSA